MLVDIHCHILPELDDGASSPDEAIAMAHMAVASGVTAIVATPHFPGKHSSMERIEPLLDRYDWFRRVIRSLQLPLKLYPGAEILCLPETISLAEQKLLPTLGNSSYLLTEFFFDESFHRMDALLSGLASCGYTPIVAHPERYHAIQADPELLKLWHEKGYGLQLNKGSILGAFGSDPQDAAMAALEMRTVHMIASDAHSARHRTTHMGAIQNWLEDNCTPEFVRLLLEQNPTRVISGKNLLSAL